MKLCVKPKVILTRMAPAPFGTPPREELMYEFTENYYVKRIRIHDSVFINSPAGVPIGASTNPKYNLECRKGEPFNFELTRRSTYPPPLIVDSLALHANILEHGFWSQTGTEYEWYNRELILIVERKFRKGSQLWITDVEFIIPNSIGYLEIQMEAYRYNDEEASIALPETIEGIVPN